MEIASLNKSEYVFLAAQDDHWLVGTEPVAIIQDWESLQQYVGTHWLIGYIGYEEGYRFVDPKTDSVLHSPKSDELTLPNVYFGAFEEVATVQPDELVQQRSTHYAASPLSLQSNISDTEYQTAFHSILDHISAGDIYQANLSHRLQAALPDSFSSPLDVFLHLYDRQPTMYSAYIQTPEFAITSLSPELFLRLHNTVLSDAAKDAMKKTITNHAPTMMAETRPMKGTRRRGATASEDNQLRDELLHSKKENAELDMIIDIHRNDLARTALPGSVNVIDRKHIQKLTTVWQAEAIIQSHIDPRFSTLDVIAQCFPAGSVTGAPKIRAMEILHELEPARRNIYTGAIGYIAPGASIEATNSNLPNNQPTQNSAHCEAQFNVAIRTAIIKDRQLYYSVGGGIVFDSEYVAEYQESLIKANVITSMQ